MRIMHTESSSGLGGQELRILTECEGIARRGHEVLLIAQNASRLAPLARNAGIPVTTVRMNRWALPHGIRQVYSIITRFAPHIVNAHSSTDTWIAGIAGRLSPVKPVIIRTRHKSTPISTGFLSRLLYQRLSDRIIATGETIHQAMRLRNGFDSSRIRSIPTGIDFKRLQKDGRGSNFREELAIPHQGVLIGMVAFLRYEKGPHVFIEASRAILQSRPNAWFCIVGDGPMNTRLGRQIHDLGLEERVRLLGYRTDVPRILAALDVVVVPALAGDGVPQVVVQALGLEKSVVATDAGGIREVVIDGHTGLLAPPGDVEALAKAVLTLINHPRHGAQMGITGRCFVEQRYSLDRMIEDTEQLYHTALSELRSSRRIDASCA